MKSSCRFLVVEAGNKEVLIAWSSIVKVEIGVNPRAICSIYLSGESIPVAVTEIISYFSDLEEWIDLEKSTEKEPSGQYLHKFPCCGGQPLLFNDFATLKGEYLETSQDSKALATCPKCGRKELIPTSWIASQLLVDSREQQLKVKEGEK